MIFKHLWCQSLLQVTAAISSLWLNLAHSSSLLAISGRRWFQWKSCNTDQWIQPRESQTMPARHHGDPNFSSLSEPMEKQDFEPWSQHQDSRNSSVSESPETIQNTDVLVCVMERIVTSEILKYSNAEMSRWNDICMGCQPKTSQTYEPTRVCECHHECAL